MTAFGTFSPFHYLLYLKFYLSGFLSTHTTHYVAMQAMIMEL